MSIICSYCNQQGHNIRCCNSPNILRHFNLIKSYYFKTIRLGLNQEESRNRFKRLIGIRCYLKDIRAIATQYANSITGLRKDELVLNIWMYFRERIPVVLPLESELIETDEPEITWYIDINPDPELLDFAERNRRSMELRVTKYNIMPNLSVIETREELEEKCDDCAICLEEAILADMVTINCGHQFCGKCIATTLKTHRNEHAGPSCALCRALMSSIVVKKQEIYNLVAEHCNL